MIAVPNQLWQPAEAKIDDVDSSVRWYCQQARVQKGNVFVAIQVVEGKDEMKIVQVSDNICEELELQNDKGEELLIEDVLGRNISAYLSATDHVALRTSVLSLRSTSDQISHNFSLWRGVAKDLPQASRHQDLLGDAFQRWRNLDLLFGEHLCYVTLCLSQSPRLILLNIEVAKEEFEHKRAYSVATTTSARDSDLEDIRDERIKSFSKASVLSVVQGHMTRSPNLQVALDQAAAAVQETMHADRVVVYRFEQSDWHGEVVAERLGPGISSQHSLLGLSFPSTDIPTFARVLFSKVPYRLITNATASSPYSCIIPPVLPIKTIYGEDCVGQKGGDVVTEPTDISESPGRWVAACHLKYMQNLGVFGSMVLPLFSGNNLWGIIGIHMLSGPFAPHPADRDIVALIALQVSVNIDSRSANDSAKLQVLVHRLTGEESELDAGSLQTMLAFLNCDCVGILSSDKEGETSRVLQQCGPVKAKESTLISITNILRPLVKTKGVMKTDQGNGLLMTTCLSDWVKDAAILQHSEAFAWAGTAIISIGCFSMVLLKREDRSIVTWAGASESDTAYAPRKTFAARREVPIGKSKQWAPEHVQFLSQWCTELDKQQAKRLLLSEQQMLANKKDVARMAETQKSSFLRHMSHELRTPFNGLLGMLSLLLRSELTEDQMELAVTCHSCAADMLDILDDVLLVSKLENDKVILRSVPFNIAVLAARAWLLMGVRALQLQVKLSLRIVGFGEELFLTQELDHHAATAALELWNKKCPLETTVIGDPGRLRQIALNLLGNAVKFTPKLGAVTINLMKFQDVPALLSYAAELDGRYKCCSLPPDQLEERLISVCTSETNNNVNCVTGQGHGEFKFCYAISIEDTGPGIKAEDLGTLFMAFNQLDNNPRSRAYEGTGLGLLISRELVSLMGGHIAVHSTVGEGSCFTIFITLYASASALLTKESTASTSTYELLNHNDDDQAGDSQLSRPAASVNGATRLAKPPPLSVQRSSRGVSPVLAARALSGGSNTSSEGLNISTTNNTGGMLMSPSNSPRIRQLTNVRDIVAKKLNEGKKAVLVVDDNKVNRMVLSRMITKSRPDIELLVAKSGEEAVQLATSRHADIAMTYMDLFMPGMDGWQATTAIREFEEKEAKTNERTVIVALTADVLADYESLSIFDAGLNKPITYEVVQSFIGCT